MAHITMVLHMWCVVVMEKLRVNVSLEERGNERGGSGGPLAACQLHTATHILQLQRGGSISFQEQR